MIIFCWNRQTELLERKALLILAHRVRSRNNLCIKLTRVSEDTTQEKSKSNLNKVVVLLVDVRETRLVVGVSSVVPSVPSVDPDPDPDSWRSRY